MKAVAGVFILCGSAAQAAWQQPLSADETSLAIELVSANATSGRTTQSLTPPDHPLGAQVLLVELREQKNAGDQRLAEVFIYDYSRQMTELFVIDIDNGNLVDTIDIDSPHLPLSEAEIEYSKKIVLSNDALRERVRDELDRVRSTGLGGLQQRVSVWVPQSSQDSPCDYQRCALISLFTSDEQSLSIEPVVNLISGEVFIELP